MDKEVKIIKKTLKEIKNPYIFFDNDADGFCSFYQITKLFDSFSFTMVKDRPLIDERFYNVLDESEFDSIIILDIANISEGFLKKYSNYKIIWIDHHPNNDFSNYKNLLVLNSSNEKKKYPTSMLVYKIVKKDKLPMIIGCVSDWYVDRVILNTIKKERLQDISNNEKDIGNLLFHTKLGEKILILNFSLKANVNSFKRNILRLLEIDLRDLDNEKNPFYKKAKRIYTKYESILNYKPLINTSDFYYMKYYDDVFVSTEVSNSLLVRYPEKKVVIVAKDRIDKITMSLRSNGHINLTELTEYIFSQMDGFGGGHQNAAGCSIRKEDEDYFLEIIKNNVKNLI